MMRLEKSPCLPPHQSTKGRSRSALTRVVTAPLCKGATGIPRFSQHAWEVFSYSMLGSFFPGRSSFSLSLGTSELQGLYCSNSKITNLFCVLLCSWQISDLEVFCCNRHIVIQNCKKKEGKSSKGRNYGNMMQYQQWREVEVEHVIWSHRAEQKRAGGTHTGIHRREIVKRRVVSSTSNLFRRSSSKLFNGDSGSSTSSNFVSKAPTSGSQSCNKFFAAAKQRQQHLFGHRQQHLG